MHGRWERDSRHAADLLAAAAVRSGLRPVALHDAQQARGWRAMLTDFAADWFHPDDRGHRVWAAALWDRIATDVALLDVRTANVWPPFWPPAAPSSGTGSSAVDGDGLWRATHAAAASTRFLNADRGPSASACAPRSDREDDEPRSTSSSCRPIASTSRGGVGLDQPR